MIANTVNSSLNLDSVMLELASKGSKRNLAGMQRFGITTHNGLGVSIPNIRSLAKKIGPNHSLALKLWGTKVHEARILAPMIEEPASFSSSQADLWTSQLYSWDVCDQYCGNLVWQAPFAWEKVWLWAQDEREFVRRAGFALIAALTVKDKEASNSKFLRVLPLIEKYSFDNRNFVRKAVNWALRQIGKRNRVLNRAAISCGQRIKSKGDASSRWIAADALRELQSDAVARRLGKKA